MSVCFSVINSSYKNKKIIGQNDDFVIKKYYLRIKIWLIMKQLFVILAIVIGLGSCATAKDKAQRLAEERRDMARLSDSLSVRTLTIDFDYVIPQRMLPRHLSSNYSVRIQGDSVFSYLPFFGVAYDTDFSNRDRSPLDFQERLSEYDVSQPKTDRFDVTLVTRRNRENLIYRIEIFGNGRATLNVNSSSRESISFNGTAKLEQP